MRTLDEHRAKLREICDFAFKHGTDAVTPEIIDKNIKKEKWDPKIKEKFLKYCHIGFAKAQDLLIEEVIEYQLEYRETKASIKDFSRNGKREKANETKKKLEIIRHRLQCFTHIANGIAWQLIGAQIHIARRLFIGQDSMNFLDSSNIEHSKRVADEINKDHQRFALISDLTGFIQIGDILVRHERGIGIMELKEGKVNDQIEEFFKKVMSDDKKEELDKEFPDEIDEKLLKQIERRLRQDERMVRAVNVLNNDEGVDPKTGKQITIYEPMFETEYYLEELNKLEGILKEKNWANNVIEGCLLIGMYKDEVRDYGKFMLEKILKDETEHYLIIDYLTIIQVISQPLFAKNFSPDFIIDILTGKVRVFIGIDGDELIKIFEHFKVEAAWMSKKMTEKYKQQNKEIVVFNGQGLKLKYPTGLEGCLTGGFMSKVVYDNIKPSSMIASIVFSKGPNDPKE